MISQQFSSIYNILDSFSKQQDLLASRQEDVFQMKVDDYTFDIGCYDSKTFTLIITYKEDWENPIFKKSYLNIEEGMHSLIEQISHLSNKNQNPN
jgi:hypothetical protein